MDKTKTTLTSMFIFLVSLLISHQSTAQVIVKSGNILEEISTIISDMPGNSGDNYATPTSTELNTWNSAITLLLENNYSDAAIQANTLAYDIIELTDTTTTPSQTYYMLKTNSSNHWGSYIYNPAYCRPMVIQSPHPKYDFNTGKEGVFVFKQTNALFFCMSGTHRCNSSEHSSCDGSTKVCSSSSEDYRISDLAHNNSSIFQATTQILLDTHEEAHFIQLHGFSKKDTDPYVILSNGTTEIPTTDYIVSFQEQLFLEDNSLSFKVAHIDLSWTRLRGFSNTQGRLINESDDFCTENATTTSGRFFHVEQEKTKLRADITGWTKVSNALSNTFTCTPTVSVKDEISKNDFALYPNPTNAIMTIEGIDIDINEIKIYNLLGQNLTKDISFTRESKNQLTLDLTKLLSGTYIVRVKNKAIIVYKK